jgi:hypothetical protein
VTFKQHLLKENKEVDWAILAYEVPVPQERWLKLACTVFYHYIMEAVGTELFDRVDLVRKGILLKMEAFLKERLRPHEIYVDYYDVFRLLKKLGVLEEHKIPYSPEYKFKLIPHNIELEGDQLVDLL